MKSIFSQSVPGRHACMPSKPAATAADMLPAALLRGAKPDFPELSELDVVRHFTNLSKRNFGVDGNFYPLGSCTMKYNPKFCETVAALPGFANLHPMLPQVRGAEGFAQGSLECLWEMEQWLCEISGMKAFTLQPMAGANGEFTGAMLIAAYHKAKGHKKTKIICPDSAHGTNPASAALAGFDVVNITSTDGIIDPAALAAALDDDTAALMMTCPNTLGIFEDHLPQIVEMLRAKDALLYYDGANMNAILGKMRVGDVGFDIVHWNLHKTLATPHGGGGPGAGPVGVSARVAEFLPSPLIVKKADGTFSLNFDCPKSIGHIAPFYGSFAVVLKAYAYVLRLGSEGLIRVSEHAVLNANYIKKMVEGLLTLPHKRICAHEFVASAPDDMRALDIAKALLDEGIHAPTIYFPLIVKECLMIEPTETESKETIDHFVETLRSIIDRGRKDPQYLHDAPVKTPVRRLDETAAARNMVLTEDMAK